MDLVLKRKWFSLKSTIGELFSDGKFICYILEDVARPNDVKIYGHTCIPTGLYDIKVTHSPKYKREMPLVYNAPDMTVVGEGDVSFEGIRIHSGNDRDDTLGCLLPGTTKGVDFVGSSRDAYKKVFDMIQSAGSVSLQIINEQGIEEMA